MHPFTLITVTNLWCHFFYKKLVLTKFWERSKFVILGLLWLIGSTKRPILGFFVTQKHLKRYQQGLLIGPFIILGSVGAYLVKKVELDHQNCSKTVFLVAKLMKICVNQTQKPLKILPKPQNNNFLINWPDIYLLVCSGVPNKPIICF